MGANPAKELARERELEPEVRILMGKYQLPLSAVKAIRRAFQQADSDDNGVIDMEEFHNLFEEADSPFLKYLFTNVGDTNNDNELSLDEFMEVVCQFSLLTEDEVVERIFVAVDSDIDYLIDFQEFDAFATAMKRSEEAMINAGRHVPFQMEDALDKARAMFEKHPDLKLSMKEWKVLCLSNPKLVWPIHRLHIHIQHIMGEDWWKRHRSFLTEERKRMHPDDVYGSREEQRQATFHRQRSTGGSGTVHIEPKFELFPCCPNLCSCCCCGCCGGSNTKKKGKGDTVVVLHDLDSRLDYNKQYAMRCIAEHKSVLFSKADDPAVQWLAAVQSQRHHRSRKNSRAPDHRGHRHHHKHRHHGRGKGGDSRGPSRVTTMRWEQGKRKLSTPAAILLPGGVADTDQFQPPEVDQQEHQMQRRRPSIPRSGPVALTDASRTLRSQLIRSTAQPAPQVDSNVKPVQRHKTEYSRGRGGAVIGDHDIVGRRRSEPMADTPVYNHRRRDSAAATAGLSDKHVRQLSNLSKSH